MPILFLNEAEVRDLLVMDRALERIEAAFRHLAEGKAQNEPRRRVIVPHGATLHVLAASDSATGYLGLKTYSTSRHGARFLVLLYRADTGEPVAEVEADYLGQVRTGAATGVATRLLARQDASVLGVIGTGLQAFTQVQAIARVRALRLIRVYGRDAGRRREFAERVGRETGAETAAAAEARGAVAGADIVVTATNSREPVLLGEWLAPGVHVNAIGANMLNRRELDDEAVRRAEVIVTDSIPQALLESGELVHALGEGREGWERVMELAAIVAQPARGRQSGRQITLFKSNGIALEDIAAAGYVYERAKETGTGRQLPVFGGNL